MEKPLYGSEVQGHFLHPTMKSLPKDTKGKKNQTQVQLIAVLTETKGSKCPRVVHTPVTSIQKASSRLPCTVIISNNSNKRLKRKMKRVVEETAQQRGALAALAEDPGLVPIIHTMAYDHL